MQQLQLGRIGVAAQAIGIGRGAFDLAVKYARKRIVLGEKLADKQLVKAKLSEMATELEAARLLCKNLVSFYNHEFYNYTNFGFSMESCSTEGRWW